MLDASGALACRVWIYLTDNGTVFRGDTLEIIAGCSQGGVDSDDEKLALELVAARRALSKKDIRKGSCIKFFGD